MPLPARCCLSRHKSRLGATEPLHLPTFSDEKKKHPHRLPLGVTLMLLSVKSDLPVGVPAGVSKRNNFVCFLPRPRGRPWGDVQIYKIYRFPAPSPWASPICVRAKLRVCISCPVPVGVPPALAYAGRGRSFLPRPRGRPTPATRRPHRLTPREVSTRQGDGGHTSPLCPAQPPERPATERPGSGSGASVRGAFTGFLWPSRVPGLSAPRTSPG